ncbi:MAG: chorismate lyase [Gammaproteobacteria bacterium]|uniref:chorismate--pyruvate lyase family protein n=1 Tax=Rhodoferax sp. TaxID=50421 RepID=UPI00182F70E6|nr:chorismate lyase [Rhodoferax sp.]MBU3898857.1 chorismate lyase [Gammaproteobacteria bacterium]MBA3059479.1 chorismate lyase [Rhodoferax sp.]MBU3999048.1 chorismate lyase [Gammaproteobacteria bacterium]MBU4019333.1 chorismate lyase [Gammaproteobacteria bacterium]MBU4081897.1 chorismate lyase [Gammaproteobacteria bacterium]
MTAWSQRNVQRGNRKRWLGAAGSLSARLAGAGQCFSVQVLSQGLQPLHPDEARALGLRRSRAGYVREVLLRVDATAVVFARSVTTHPHSQGPWRAIRGLGTRPLADVLFRQHAIARSPLQFASLRGASPLHRHVARAWQGATGAALASRTLPARRSVFTRGAAPLLVMEVFAAAQAPWGWPTNKWRRRAPVLARTSA